MSLQFMMGALVGYLLVEVLSNIFTGDDEEA